MNKTYPPINTPLYWALNLRPKRACSKCKHLWYYGGLYYCGKSGKIILAIFVEKNICGAFEKGVSDD